MNDQERFFDLLKELIKEIAFLNATLTQEFNEIRIFIDNLVKIANKNAK